MNGRISSPRQNWTEFIKQTCSWRAEYMNITVCKRNDNDMQQKTTKYTVDINKQTQTIHTAKVRNMKRWNWRSWRHNAVILMEFKRMSREILDEKPYTLRSLLMCHCVHFVANDPHENMQCTCIYQPESKTIADNTSIRIVEWIIADCSPNSAVIDFQSSAVVHQTSCQPYTWTSHMSTPFQ